MADDFSQEQRDVLEKMVNTAIDLRVLRTDDPSGDKRAIPDTEWTRQIAAEAAEKAIKNWESRQKPWWDIRARRDSQIAAGGLAVVILLGIADWFMTDRAMLRKGLHHLAGTEGVIETEVTTILADWADRRDSVPGEKLEAGVSSRITALTNAPEFQERTGEALFNAATRKAPEFVKLVTDILDSRPILMFQGEAHLGGSMPVAIPNTECIRTVDHWYSNVPQILPADRRPAALLSAEGLDLSQGPLGEDDIAAFNRARQELYRMCPGQGLLGRSRSLEVPFWARLHPDKTGSQDEVRILIQVAALTVDADGSHLPYDIWKGPYAIRLDYSNPRTGAQEGANVDLRPGMTPEGNNYWLARIDDPVRAVVPKLVDGDYRAYDVLHSVTISLPDLLEDATCGAASHPVPCLEEIGVRVLVIVNRKER